jgi:hypothetical protein
MIQARIDCNLKNRIRKVEFSNPSSLFEYRIAFCLNTRFNIEEG